jgi:hypothetical protein
MNFPRKLSHNVCRWGNWPLESQEPAKVVTDPVIILDGDEELTVLNAKMKLSNFWAEMRDVVCAIWDLLLWVFFWVDVSANGFVGMLWVREMNVDGCKVVLGGSRGIFGPKWEMLCVRFEIFFCGCFSGSMFLQMGSLGCCESADAKYLILDNSHGFPSTLFQI